MPRSSWLQLSVILLASCGMGEASPIQAPARQESSDLRVVTRSELSGNRRDCGYGDAMTLVVLEGSRQVLTRNYCSAYDIGEARLVTDARGKHYVLLEHAEGRGTGVTTNYLTVYELGVGLTEMARLMVEGSAGSEAHAVYEYAVQTPADGGLILSGSWNVEGQPDADDANLAGRRSVVEIETSPPPARR